MKPESDSPIADPKKSRTKRIVFFLLALPLVALVYLVLAEVGMRTFLGYQIEAAKQRSQYSFTLPDAVRIMCLGDSHTEGAEAPEGQSYPDALQRLLDANCAGRKSEVLNFGFSGRDMSHLRVNANNWITNKSLRPDIMIIQGGLNSFSNWDYFQRYVKKNNIDTPWYYRLLTRAMVTHFFDPEKIFEAYEGLDYFEFVRETSFDEYSLIVEMCTEYKIRPVFLTYFSISGNKELAVELQMDLVAFKYKLPYIRSIQPTVREYLEQNDWIAPNDHPTAEGYELMAKCVYQSLQKEFPDLFTCNPVPVPEGLCESQNPS